MKPEQRPIIIAEDKAADRFVIANNERNMVQINVTPLEGEAKRYTVTGRLPLERHAITGILGAPFGQENSDWSEVRDGLRDISYPSKSVRSLAHTALQRDHLREIGPAARELAKALTDNQDQRTQTANMPVFNDFQSYEYVAEELRRRTSSTKLMNYLKGIGMEFRTIKGFKHLTTGDPKSIEAAQELEAQIGLDEEDVLDMQNSALLAEAGGSIEAELMYRVKGLVFVGFRALTIYGPTNIEGGGHDASFFLRTADIPENLHGVLNSTKVAVQAMLRDADKKTGLNRAKVLFSTQAPRVVVHPQLVWETRDGERRLQFPSTPYRRQTEWEHTSRPERPNSILGAAMIADYLAGQKNIDYKTELEKRYIMAERRKGRHGLHDVSLTAGLLPIVLDHKQNQLLDDDYFKAIEDLANKR